jgi:hypothetical protein
MNYCLYNVKLFIGKERDIFFQINSFIIIYLLANKVIVYQVSNVFQMFFLKFSWLSLFLYIMQLALIFELLTKKYVTIIKFLDNDNKSNYDIEIILSKEIQ